MHKKLYAKMFFKNGRAPLKSQKFFNLRSHGEINISPDIAARLQKYCSNDREIDQF